MDFVQISYDKAKDLIDSEQVTVADVRSRESFKDGHIPCATHLSMANLEVFCDLSDKTKAVLVYCYHGISSQSVAQHLIAQGFRKVYSLVGGYEAWQVHHSAAE